METIRPDGSVRPGGGTLAVYEAPNGPGVRTDGFGYAGYRTSGAFDSLLAKVIAHSPSPDFAAAVARATRALERIPARRASPPTSAFLRNILAHPDFVAGKVHTRWVDEHVAALARAGRVSGSASSRPRSARRADGRVCRRAGQQPRSAGAVRARRRGESRAARRRRQPMRPSPDMTGPDGSAGVASPDPGHHRCDQRRRGRRGARGPAGRGRRSDEDGARHHRPARRHRARGHDGGGRRRARRLSDRVRPGSRGRRAAPSPPRTSSTSITSATTCAKTSSAMP